MFRGTNLTIEKHSGGKSTWSHLLARCSWASHCTPLSFSFLFCKKISHPANNMYWIKLNCFAWNSVLSTTSLPNLTFHLVLPEAPFFQPLGLCSCCCLGQNALLPPPCLTSTSTDPPYLPDFSMPTLFFFNSSSKSRVISKIPWYMLWTSCMTLITCCNNCKQTHSPLWAWSLFKWIPVLAQRLAQWFACEKWPRTTSRRNQITGIYNCKELSELKGWGAHPSLFCGFHSSPYLP